MTGDQTAPLAARRAQLVAALGHLTTGRLVPFVDGRAAFLLDGVEYAVADNGEIVARRPCPDHPDAIAESYDLGRPVIGARRLADWLAEPCRLSKPHVADG